MCKKVIFPMLAFFVVLVCMSLLIKFVFIHVFFSEPIIIQQETSPDGRYIAYIFESNGGATTGWIYHISVLPSNKPLRKGNGNIYVSDMRPEKLEWTNDNQLYVHDYKNLRTTKRKERIYDISIDFQSLN